jgi:hypothetical protein
MKRIYCLLAVTCLLFSCKDESKTPASLSVDLTALSFTSEGGQKSFNIRSNTAWTIECPARWLVSSTAGNGSTEVVVTAGNNPSAATRTGIITVAAEGLQPVEITLEQSGSEPAIFVSKQEIIAPAGKTSADITVTANIEYRYSVSETWLRVVSGENNILKLEIDENRDERLRTAEIAITCDQPAANRLIPVTQNGNGVLPVITVPGEPSGGFAFDARRWIRIRTEITCADAVAWSVNGQAIPGEADLLHVMTVPGNYTFRLTANNMHGMSIKEIPVTIVPKTYGNNVTAVFDFLPAPGQYTNVMPGWVAGDTQQTMNAKALAAIRERNGISLGGFGGYVVMGFDHVLVNTDGAYDFRIKGNALPTWAEPGVIMVSYDANGNGLPDDEWFEIAGSAYNDASTIRDYEITYTLAQAVPMLVAWTDNKGVTGVISQNVYRGQNYFPGWLSQKSYTLKGTRLTEKNVYDTSGNGTYWVSTSFGHGYADNCSESQDCSKIELDWAVDGNGNPVKLKGIDFIRVHCSMNTVAGWQGEVSTEIYGFEEFNVGE